MRMSITFYTSSIHDGNKPKSLILSQKRFPKSGVGENIYYNVAQGDNS